MNPILAQLVPSFLVPSLAVAGVLAVSIPIIIHILSKRPRRPEPWGAMRFLFAAYRKHKLRTRFEQWLLLALRCLLVLLVGCALAEPTFSALRDLAGFGAGRTVVIVMDDSITAGASDRQSHTRFQLLQDAADKLLAALGPGDRVGLVTASRPAEPLIAPPVSDPAAVRARLRELAPQPAAAELREALLAARKSIELSDAKGGEASIVLFSDLSSGSVGASRGNETTDPPGDSLAAGNTTILHNEPLPPLNNVQIVSFQPERNVVLPRTAGERPSVEWRIRLRRNSIGEASAASVPLRVTLENEPPVLRTVTFEKDLLEAEVSVTTPLHSPGLISATAALEPLAGRDDSLDGDNVRHALVRYRERITVLLVGADSTEPADGPFSPQRWMAAVLAPVSDRLGWPVEVRPIDASAIGSDAAALGEADVAIVLRPDRLTDAAFADLRDWVEAGGVAWFFTPPDADASHAWPQQLTAAFNLTWSIGQRVVVPGSEGEANALRLKTTSRASGELARLGADWEDLLRPVEVYRRLPVEPGSLGFGVEPLLEGVGGEPILIAATSRSGLGRILLTATALDTNWTNLPAKPLFVPLVHETLRGNIDRLRPPLAFEPGDRPELGRAFVDAGKVAAPSDETILLVRETGGGTTVAENGGITRPTRPLDHVGIYRTPTDAFIVNINADAAQTGAADPAAVDALFKGMGTPRTLSLDDPAAAFSTPSEAATIGWPLLWIVLALVLGETLLARRVSHASTRGQEASIR